MVERKVIMVKKGWFKKVPIIVSDCNHDWVEIGKGQYKEYHFGECRGNRIVLKCKKCGDIKGVPLDIQVSPYY